MSATSGSFGSGPRDREPITEPPNRDVDIAAVALDDAALDELARDPVACDRTDAAMSVLALLRADVDADLPPVLPVAESSGVVPLSSRRSRLGRRTVVAAAVSAAVLSVSGVAAAGIASGPGGSLYPIHKLFLGADQSASQKAAAQVRHFLHLADGDITANRLPAASAALDNAGTWLTRVDASDRGALPAQLAAMQQRYAAAVTAVGGRDDHGGATRGGDDGSAGDNSGRGKSGDDSGDHSGGDDNSGPGSHDDGSNSGSGSSGSDNSGSGHGSGDDSRGSGDTSGRGSSGSGSGVQSGGDDGGSGKSGSGDDHSGSGGSGSSGGSSHSGTDVSTH